MKQSRTGNTSSMQEMAESEFCNPIGPGIASTIRIKARQLVGRAGFTRDDVEDIEQELRLAILERVTKYDQTKSTTFTFYTRIIERKISNMLRDRTTTRRDVRHVTCSLSDELEQAEGEHERRSETMDADAVDIQLGRRQRTECEAMSMRMDMASVIVKLPCKLRRIAQCLLKHTPTDTAKLLNIPRCNVYFALREMRPYFEKAMLGKYL